MNQQDNRIRAAIYCRVAGAPLDNHFEELEIQERRLTAYAEEYGYQVVGCFKEQGSGLTLDREKLNAVKDLADKKAIDRILVVDMQRIGKNCMEVGALIYDFIKKGVTVESLDGVDIDDVLNLNAALNGIYKEFMSGRHKKKSRKINRPGLQCICGLGMKTNNSQRTLKPSVGCMGRLISRLRGLYRQNAA